LDIPEKRIVIVSVLITSDENCIISKIFVNKEIVAYCLCFKRNCLELKRKLSGILLPIEINCPKIVIIKMVQKYGFSQKIQQMQVNQEVSPKNKLYILQPFLDENVVHGVVGRLKYAVTLSIF